MILANIISEHKVDAPEGFKVYSSPEGVDMTLPTLLVGYDYVSKNYAEYDLLNTCLKENLYWTLKRTERRDKYEEDLANFISVVYKKLTDKLVYLFVDPIQYRGKTLNKIIRKLYSLNELITFEYNDMFYLYEDTFIFGIDMKLLSFMGLNVNKIKSKIKSRSLMFLGNEKILIEYKKTIEVLNNQIRFIPYLYSLINGKNNTFSVIHKSSEN